MRPRVFVVVCVLAGFALAGCGRPLQDPGAASLASGAPGASAAPAGAPSGEGAPEVPVDGASPAASDVPPPEGAAGAPSASASGQPPVPEPSAGPAPTPTVDPAFAGVALPPPAERWRYMQLDRQVFDGVQTYTTAGPETLWWYDPLFGQSVALGEINGEFPVQATFRLRGQEAAALEVPYQINTSFGLRLPDAIQTRMRNAGAGEWVETYVYAKSDIQPR